MKNKNNNKISRSKIELFMECQRCFWLEAKYNIKRPETISGGYIGQNYDPILKRVFDEHRQNSTKPKEIEEKELDLFPDLEKIKIWRGKGVEFYHHEHKLTYYGKIDDLLITKEKLLVPFDFKTTLSKNFQIYESYKRQLEIYGYLLQKQNEPVSNLGALYVIKIEITENFEKIEERDLLIIENLEYEKYDEILENLKEVYYSDKEPDPHPACPFCYYFEKRKLL